MTKPLPPMLSGGLPVFGHALEMLGNREKLFKRGHAEKGDLFAIKLGPKNVVVITGAENNRMMYTETDKSLNMQDGYAFLKKSVGEVLFTASKEDYYNQRPVLQEIFRRERMTSYVQAMNIEVQKWLDSLGKTGEIDITKEMLRLTQYVAGHAFVGANFQAELGEDFWECYADISASLDPILPPNLPLPKFIRRDRARKVIYSRLESVIRTRRQNPDRYDDLITALMTTPLKDGSLIPDELIINMFIAFIFAGHETTAGQAAWLIALLLQHPAYLEQLKSEIHANAPYGTALDGATLSRLEHVYMAIDETTRMRPSADTQIRTVDQPLDMGDYEIPAGWMMMVSGATSHFLPDVFKNPERFDPLRFSAERGEGKNPFAIVGFGGGMHKCTGMNFAKNEMAIITTLLFQQFDVQLLSEDIRVVMGNGANHPSAVRVRYQRKPLSELTDAATIKAAVEGGCPHITRQVTP